MRSSDYLKCDDQMAPNIILLVCDTLTHYALRFLGSRSEMPNLNEFVKDSMIYENCIAPETWTFPSHASLFMGMYANEHGIHETKDIKLDNLWDYNSKLSTERLAEKLQSKGYNTIGVSNNYMVSRFTGFDYGFDFFFNIDSSPWGRSKLATEAKQMGSDSFQVMKELIGRGRIGEIPKFAQEYLKVRNATRLMDYPREKGAKLTNEMVNNMTLRDDFFLFINFWELHDPYRGQDDKVMQDNFTGVKKINGAQINYLKEEYAREAKYTFGHLENFMSMLKRRRLYDDSMIIITSDHGQAFNEHGFMLHGIYLYDEIIRVPLIIKYPKSKKFRKKEGYQSLVSVPKLIEEVAEGGDDSSLTTEKAFSEAYGNIDRPPKSYSHRMDYVNSTYEKSRAAVYMDDYKLTVNGTDGKIDEFLKGTKPVDIKAREHKSAFEELSAELKRFKKKERFTIPE